MTYEEWLKKRQQNQTAGNTGGSSDSAEEAATSQSTGEGMSYEEWMNAREGNGAEELWEQSGIEAMDRDFWAFAKDERRWLEQGAFSRQYSSNAERWRGNIAQERAWLEKYGARLGENAQRISDALDSYEDTLNYYDSLYAATEEYKKAGQKISDYITAGVDTAQIDMAGLLQGKANVSSGATVVLATDQYSKEQEQLMQSFQPFTTGTAMDKDNQAALGKEVSGQRARTKMALAWLDQHQKELGEETYQGLKGYYENTLTQLDLMDSTIQWYADGKSAAVYQDMGSMIKLFQEGKAPTAELAQQEESLYAEVQALQEQVDTWQQQYDDMREAINEGRISEKNLQAAQENLNFSRDNLRGYQQMLQQKEQELREVQERSDFYWILAMSSTQEDGAEEKIEIGKEKYERIYGLWEQAVNNSPEAVGYEKKYLTFENEKEYENAVENYLVNGVKLQDKKVLPNGRIQATIYTENYTQDLTPARARERQNFPLAIDTEHLTDKEKNTFYYLVGAGYDSMAIDYAQSMAIERRKERMQEIEEWAGQNIGTQMLALVQQSLLFPLAGKDLLSSQGYEQDTGLRANPKLGPAAIKDSLNSGVVKAWDKWSGTLPNNIPVLGGKGLGSVYQMGVSVGESYGSGATFGPAAIIFMGMSAASSAYNEAIMNGATQEEAELQGAAQGVAEALYEKISVGHWLDGKDYGSIVKNALVQGGVEASEEMLTSVTNAITDRLIMQDKSAFNTAIQSYIDQGYSKEEAEDKAWRELLEEIAFDSVSGFITGGVMGGASSAVNYISTGKTAQQIMAGADSSRLEDLQGFYVAQLAAGVQEADTAQEQKKKIAAWLRQGGEYTSEQLQQARSMAEDKINGREVVYPQAQEEAEPEYTGQRYEMAAEEIINNARAMATEGFTGLGMSQREAEQIANNLERAIRTGEITDKRIDQMQPTDTGYLAVIEDALNVEIPQAKGIVQARANVRAAIEAARARYLGEATAPAIEIGQEQAEQLRTMSDEELQLQLELERELRDDTSAQPIVRQQAQQALDVLEQEYQRRNGGAKNVQQQEQAAPAPAAKQGKQAEGGTQVRNAEPQRNDRVGAGEQGGAVPERNAAKVEQRRQGANDQGDRGKGVRKKRDLSRFENIAKTKSTRDYLGKAGAEEVTLGEVTEEYWTDEMRQAAEKAEAAGLTVHYVVGSILRANGDRGGGGVYYRGTILASVNDVRFLPEQLVEHEIYHADATEEATEEILAAIRERYTEEEFERIVREYADEYEGIIAEDDVQALYEEIAADAAGGMNRFADTGKIAERREQAQEIISRKGREAQRGDRARAPPAEPKYSYAGETAKTADLKSLKAAQEMLKLNASMEDIRKATGWHQGKDGKWRFEIDDSEMKYFRGGDAQFRRDHPEYAEYQTLLQKMLFGTITSEEYSRMQEIDSTWGNEYGRLRDRLRSGSGKLVNVIQHDALFAAYPELENVEFQFQELPAGVNGYFDKAQNRIVLSEKLANAPESAILHEIQHVIQIYEGFAPGASMEYWEAKAQEQGLTAEELYRNTAGEIEARDAAARRKLTAEERKKTSPDYGDENTVFASKSERAFSAVTEANDAAYMEAVEAGDMETAQRMVDEAAKKAGYTNSEDWRMDHRAPTDKDDTAHSIDQIDKAYGNDGSIYSPQAVYYYGEYRSYDRKAINVIRMAKNNPEKMITVYRAVPLDVKDARMRNGDWVAIVREYAEEHGERMFDEDYRIIENRVPAKHIYGNGDSINEWGYDNGETREVYKNAVGNVKLAAVTYDNDGNVIPLSERFDPEQEDIRWSAASEADIERTADSEAVEEDDAKRPWEIVSDEQHAAAREMGYPVLDGEQVIPFKTWVQATDIDPDTGEPRNNYGLVVSNSVTTRQLGVNFWNKNAANGNRTEGNTEFRYVQYQDLHPVQGQYQMTDAEYASLMESVPEDVAREQIDFMGDNAAEFSKMYEEILWQREQQRLRDEENKLKLDEAPEGFPWSKKKPLRSSGTRLSPRDAAKYLAGATGKEWNIIQDPRKGTWKAVPSARPAGVAKDSEYNRLVKEAKEAGATPMSWKEFSWQKLQENAIKYGEEISTKPVRPEGIARAEFQGTQALRDLGIRISGSVVDYSDTATMRERELALRKMHKSIQKMERALRKNEGAAQLGSRTIAMAEDLAAGKIFPEDIPKTLDRRDVIKLAELKMDYKLLGEDLSKKRKLAINRGLVEKAMEMLPDAKELAEDPEAVKAVSLLLLNYGTPEDNMYQIFGDKNGRAEKLYDYYFRTVEENEAEKMRWMNRMFDEATAFRDSKGKQSRLNKAESAYVHVLLDMEGVVQNVENSKRAKEIKALAEATNGNNTEEAEKIGATLTSVEKEWAEQYARFVAEQAAAKTNKKIDQTKCENAAKHYRETFEKLYQALTDLMVTHGLTPLGHIDYYAPHLTINEKSNIMAGFFQELGLKSADGDITEIPADIAGRTQEFKPTKRWTPFLLKRKGTATDYDIVTAYETYLTYVADVLYHHDDILKLRGLETMLRNTANAEWQEQMKELLRVSAYGDINDKVELLQKLGVIDQDYEGEMSPEELLQWLDKNASVEEKHKYLVELGQLMPEEVVTEEQIHALFSELGTQQDEAFAAAVQGLLDDYGLMDSENRVTAAEATDKLNELYEAMASESRRSEAVRYSSLVNWITNYTNILAGKQYGGDRGAEYNGGRKMVKALSNTVRRYGTAKVVGNLSSVLSQVAQVPLIMAETSAKSQIMALRDIMSQITKENRVQLRGWGNQVDLLTGKKGVQYINEGVLEKVTGSMVKPMELMDRFVSLYAARAAYYDALSGKVRGIAANDQDAATRYANDFARRIMASRAKGSKPAAFHSKGFFSTMLNMFQVEQLNTVRHMLHEMPREMRRDIREYGVKKGVARYASRMMVYMMAAFLLNRGLDELYGQTPIPFDVPGYILQFIAAGYGVTANDLLTGQGELKDDFQWGDAGEELLYELGGDVPLVNNALSILGIGDQKMPLPDLSTIVDVFQSVWKAMTDEGVSGWVAAEAAAKALAEFIPGGSQIKKTVGGISALSRGGTYTDDGRLKWAVDNDPWSVIQNILFGTSSTDEAQRYYERGYGAVSENLTEAYKLLTEQGIDPDDAYDAVYGVKMAWDANEDLTYAEKKQLQRDAIQNSSLDDADKLILWTYAFGYKDDETGEIVNKDAETFLQLMEADMSWDDIMEMYNHRQELEEDDTLDDEAADLQFAHWVETHGYTKEQKAVIVDAYASGEDRYFKLADCGIGASNAKALEEAFTAFSKSLEEGKSITTTDKAKIVIGMGMPDADEYRALAAILKSGTLDRLTVATNAGISCSTWIEYWTVTAQMKNVKDENDEVVTQKRDQVLAYIDGLPLTPEQKNVLYYDQGYAESKIGEAPWN